MATLRLDILADARRANREIDGTSSKLQKFGKAAKLAGAVAGVAIGGFLKDAVTAASDLNETTSKTSAIFGDAAGDMLKWSENAAKTLGISKGAALDSAASFGNMFNQIGFTNAEAAKLSKTTLQLAADQASFNNLDPTDVAQRIQAAYRGEMDSLQALFPNINAARVEQEALMQTHKKSAKQLTAHDKALALNALMNKDGARAAGDFAKTSGGLANQQRILAAQFEDTKAKVGVALLPVMTKLANVMTGLASTLTSGSVGVKILLGVVGLLTTALLIHAIATRAVSGAMKIAAVATKAWAAAQWVWNAAMSANPIGLVIIGLVALGAGLVLAYKKSATFRAIVQGAFNAVRAVGSALVGFFSGSFLPFFTKTIPAGIALMVIRVKGHISNIVGAVTALPGRIAAAGGRLLSAGKDLMSNFWNGMKSGIGAVGDFVADIGRAITRGINSFLNLPIMVPRINTRIPGIGTVGGQTLIPAINFSRMNASTLTPQAGAMPKVSVRAETQTNVFIGNEQIDAYIDTRIRSYSRSTASRLSAGVI